MREALEGANHLRDDDREVHPNLDEFGVGAHSRDWGGASCRIGDSLS